MSKSATTTEKSRKTAHKTGGSHIAPIHPGEILYAEFLEPLDLSANALAKHIGVPGNRISAIVKGDRGITGDTALVYGACDHLLPDVLCQRAELLLRRSEVGSRWETFGKAG